MCFLKVFGKHCCAVVFQIRKSFGGFQDNTLLRFRIWNQMLKKAASMSSSIKTIFHMS